MIGEKVKLFYSGQSAGKICRPSNILFRVVESRNHGKSNDQANAGFGDPLSVLKNELIVHAHRSKVLLSIHVLDIVKNQV